MLAGIHDWVAVAVAPPAWAVPVPPEEETRVVDAAVPPEEETRVVDAAVPPEEETLPPIVEAPVIVEREVLPPTACVPPDIVGPPFVAPVSGVLPLQATRAYTSSDDNKASSLAWLEWVARGIAMKSILRDRRATEKGLVTTIDDSSPCGRDR